MIDNPWTEERVLELRRLIADRLPFSRIAARLKMSRNAVIGKARRLGIAVPAKPPDRGPNLRSIMSCLFWRAGPQRAPGALRRWSIPSAVAAESLDLRLDQLEEYHCRYITNDDLRQATYCGRRTAEGTSWCALHLQRVRRLEPVASPPLVPGRRRVTPRPKGKLHEA